MIQKSKNHSLFFSSRPFFSLTFYSSDTIDKRRQTSGNKHFAEINGLEKNIKDDKIVWMVFDDKSI